MASATTHHLYNSLPELLSPETLSRITGRRVSDVTVEELVPPSSASGNRFLSVRTQGEQTGRYVVKRFNRDGDWLMQASDDRLCREVQLWSSGILDRLPPEVTHPILACAQDGNGHAILMRDRSDLLSDKTLDEASHRCYLNALAAFHARYVDDPALLDPTLGLCDPARYFTFLSPRVLSKVRDGKLTRLFIQVWDLVEACFAPETVRVIKRLHEDPGPLCAAFQHFPQTLAHGDWAPRNLGLAPRKSSGVLAIDWQFSLRGAPVLDLFRYLIEHIAEWPVPHEASIHYYRTRYEQHSGTALNDEEWEAQVELGVLGIFLAFGGIWTHNMVNRDQLAELPWIERKIQAAAARLYLLPRKHIAVKARLSITNPMERSSTPRLNCWRCPHSTW